MIMLGWINNVGEKKDERKKRETNEEGETYPTTTFALMCSF